MQRDNTPHGTRVERLFEEHRAGVHAFLRRLCGDPDLASDLCQDAMLIAWKRREQLRTPAKFRPWLWSIAYRTWLDHQRLWGRRPVRLQVDAERLPEPPAAVESSATQREDVRRVLRVMERLPPRQRETLTMLACEGLTVAEIATITELSPGAVRANIHAARKAIRLALSDIDSQIRRRSEVRP